MFAVCTSYVLLHYLIQWGVAFCIQLMFLGDQTKFMWVTLKLPFNVSVMFEQICIFKMSIRTELALYEIDKIKNCTSSRHVKSLLWNPTALLALQRFQGPSLCDLEIVCPCVRDLEEIQDNLFVCLFFLIIFFWKHLVLPLYLFLAHGWQVLQHSQSSVPLLDRLSGKANDLELNRHVIPGLHQGV